MAIDWQAKCGAPLNAVFGAPGLYVPRDDTPPYLINGVFDEAYREVILLDVDSPNTDARPVIGINDDQRPAGQAIWDQNDRLVIPVTPDGTGGYTIPAGAVTYLVKESRPDGHGTTKLMLAKTAMYPP